MVPFQRHVQRLTRLVRQAANDTGKRAELVGAGRRRGTRSTDAGAHGAAARAHAAQLRSCTASKRRIAARPIGKPDVGRISVSLERDGAEIVIVVADDGAGINVKLIREKAIALGSYRSACEAHRRGGHAAHLWSRASAPPAESRRRPAAASAWTSWRPKSRSSAAACSSSRPSARARDSRSVCRSRSRSARR